MIDDRIPDPRDRTNRDPVEPFLPDDHAGSLAAFENWCHRVGARSALAAIAQYRRAIANSRGKET